MFEKKIENFIGEVLIGDAQKNAFELVAYLRANEMLFERGKGYWENKLYWLIKYKDEYLCFIFINDSKVHALEEKFVPWTIWSDDSECDCFEDYPLDERMKEIAWKNVDFCAHCGGNCSPGKRKIIFGKEFRNVCRTAMRFDNPDVNTLDCVKKLIEIRKNDILKNISCT